MISAATSRTPIWPSQNTNIQAMRRVSIRAISTRSLPVSSVSLHSNRSAALSSTSFFHSGECEIHDPRPSRSPALTPRRRCHRQSHRSRQNMGLRQRFWLVHSLHDARSIRSELSSGQSRDCQESKSPRVEESKSRRAMRCVLALAAAVLMTACATNPVTGKRELSFMSEEQEISVGRELDAQVRQEMGLYQNDELQRYVSDIGMGLARSSQRPNLPWSFAVVDSPAVNAFALPGGFIYITRGILPYLDNEAQLVGVLGHEIGHVTARHSAQQYTRGMATSLGVLVGSIFVPQVRPFGDLAETGLGVLFTKFGRDDELEADRLGAEYAAGGGWDPDEVPKFLTTLARISEMSDRNGVPNWMSTHPQPESRAERVTETVKKVRAGEAGTWTVERDGYLAKIDGLVFGDNPEAGHRARQRVSSCAAAVCDRVSRRMGDHEQRRAGCRAGAGKQGLHGAAHHPVAAGKLPRRGSSAAHARVRVQAD